MIIDLQWLADAMSSVVGVITHLKAAEEGGFIRISQYVKSR